MAISRSKLTSQGQISVPADVRRKLGLVPGSVIEWVDSDGKVEVRPAGKFASEDIHNDVFPKGPPKKVSPDEMKSAVGKLIRKRHARGRY
jgi:AbrB family looped-hinge helix DNA binding protein